MSMEQNSTVQRVISKETGAILDAITAVYDAKDAYFSACDELLGEKNGELRFSETQEAWDVIEDAIARLLYDSVLDNLTVRDGKTELTTI